MRLKTAPVLGLDFLRLVAAFMVVGYHLGFRAFSEQGYLLNDLTGGHAELSSWWPLTWFGWVGVQAFFVISGFVIAFSSEKATPKKFAESRLLRLVPGMWICVAVCTCLALTWGLAPQSLFWPALKTAVFWPDGPWIAGQVWTIGTELAFYAVVFALLLRGAFDRIEIVAYTLAAVSGAYWAVVTSGIVTDTFGRMTQLLLLQHGCYFALGLMLWLISRKGLTTTRLTVCAACVATAWFQIEATLIAEDPGYGLADYPGVPFAVWLSLMALLAASILFNARITASMPGFMPSLTRTAGVMTYSLYLLHYHVGGTALMLSNEAGLAKGAGLAIAFAASMVAAYASAKILEPPINKWLKNVSTTFWPDALNRRDLPVSQARP